MNTATHQRDRAARLAPTDPRAAAELARRIDDPWYRCQALAHAALHANDESSRSALLDAAFAAAGELAEPNRHATVAAWPLKVLVSHGDRRAVATQTRRLLQVVAQEPSPVRRADALRMLFGAVAAGERTIALEVTGALLAACQEPLLGGRPNRKGAALLERCLPALARIDATFAERVSRSLPPQRAERARQQIAQSSSMPLQAIVHWPNLG